MPNTAAGGAAAATGTGAGAGLAVGVAAAGYKNIPKAGRHSKLGWLID